MAEYRKRLRFSILDKLRSGELAGVVDNKGEYLEDIYIDNKIPENRQKVNFINFCKLANIDPRKLRITDGDHKYLNVLVYSMNRNNVVNFDFWESISEPTICRVRGRLKKAGLIDHLKLGNTRRWYLNPFYANKGKTVDRKLYKHFIDLIDYALR